MKTCTKCGETKPFSQFHKKSASKCGYKPRCKACIQEESMSYYKDNRTRMNEYNKAWADANRDRNLEFKARYRDKNRDCIRQKSREYSAAHPEIGRNSVLNYRARKAAASGRLSNGLGNRLMSIQKGKCACCRKPISNGYHMDHIMPLKLGGTNTDDNIQLLCQTCNLQKSARHPVDFMQSKGFLI